MNLKVVVRPQTEPVSLDEMKSYLRIFDNSFDTVLMSLIKTARIEAEKYISRAIMKQTIELSFDKLQNGVIELPRPPLLNLLSVKLYDENDVEYSVTLTDLLIDAISEPARFTLKANKSYPLANLREIGAFKIRYEAGASTTEDVNNEIKDAIKFHVAFRYENPEVSEIPKAFYNLLGYSKVVTM